MPTVLRIGPFRFYFYANEGSEPAHIHVENGDGECKFWIDDIRVADPGDLRSADLRRVERLIHEHRDHLLRSWDEFQRARRR